MSSWKRDVTHNHSSNCHWHLSKVVYSQETEKKLSYERWVTPLMILLSCMLVLFVFCGCFLTVRNICLGSLLPFGFGLKQSWTWLKNTFSLFGLTGEQQGNCCIDLPPHFLCPLLISVLAMQSICSESNTSVSFLPFITFRNCCQRRAT